MHVLSEPEWPNDLQLCACRMDSCGFDTQISTNVCPQQVRESKRLGCHANSVKPKVNLRNNMQVRKSASEKSTLVL